MCQILVYILKTTVPWPGHLIVSPSLLSYFWKRKMAGVEITSRFSLTLPMGLRGGLGIFILTSFPAGCVGRGLRPSQITVVERASKLTGLTLAKNVPFPLSPTTYAALWKWDLIKPSLIVEWCLLFQTTGACPVGAVWTAEVSHL